MSYIITLTNGNILTTIPDTQLVSTYGGIGLVGKDYVGFGTIYDNNLVHIIENFANSTPPTNPFVGQIWYDTASNSINFWNGTQFKAISVITSSPTAPLSPQEGDEWYDSINQQLYIWNGFTWILIGPPNQGGSNEGFVVKTLPTSNGNVFYLDLYANNELLGVVSSIPLVNPDFTGFGNIRPGWNFVTNPESAPLIVESGIYNITELTIGNNDQMALTTDANNNGIIQVVGGNVAIATNSTSGANAAAYAEFVNGNIEGTVYFNTIIASNYGNLPGVVGTPGEVIFNNNGNLGATPSLLIKTGNVVNANSLTVNNSITTNSMFVTTNEIVDGTIYTGFISVDNDMTVTNGNIIVVNGNINTPILNSNLIVTEQLTVTTSANISNLTAVGNLIVTNNGIISGNLSATAAVFSSIVVNGDASVTGNANISGVTTLNSGTSRQFSMPTTAGTANAVLISNGTGTTKWSSSSSHGSNSYGYYRISTDGFIQQWGYLPGPTNGTGSPATIIFPINFVNPPTKLSITDDFLSGGSMEVSIFAGSYSGGSAPTISQMQFHGSIDNNGVWWSAEGY